MNVIVGIVCFWLGIGAAYLFTHPELRTALFSRLHTSVDAAVTKIQQKVATTKAQVTTPPPAAQ